MPLTARPCATYGFMSANSSRIMASTRAQPSSEISLISDRPPIEASRSIPVAWEVPPTRNNQKGTAHGHGNHQGHLRQTVRRERRKPDSFSRYCCRTCRPNSPESTDGTTRASPVPMETSVTCAEMSARPSFSARDISRDSKTVSFISGRPLLCSAHLSVKRDDGLTFGPFEVAVFAARGGAYPRLGFAQPFADLYL